MLKKLIPVVFLCCGIHQNQAVELPSDISILPAPGHSGIFSWADDSLWGLFQEYLAPYTPPEKSTDEDTDDPTSYFNRAQWLLDHLPEEDKKLLLKMLAALKGTIDDYFTDSVSSDYSDSTLPSESSFIARGCQPEQLEALTPETVDQVRSCLGIISIPLSTSDPNEKTPSESTADRSAEDTKGTQDDDASTASGPVVQVQLSRLKPEGTTLTADISWADLPPDTSIIDNNTQLKELMRLTEWFQKQALEKIGSAKKNSARYLKKIRHIKADKKSEEYAEIKLFYEGIAELFELYADINSVVANQLQGLLIYIDAMAEFSIPVKGPLNFPYLFLNMGIIYRGDELQMGGAEKDRDELLAKHRFLSLLTAHFRETYKFIAVIDQSTAGSIADWLKASGFNSMLEVGAGLGWMQKALSVHGVSVTAIDNYQFFFEHIQSMFSSAYSPKHYQSRPTDVYTAIENELPKAQGSVELVRETDSDPTPAGVPVQITTTMAGVVQRQDWEEAARTRHQDHDVLLLANPAHRSFLQALDAWGNQKPVIFISVSGIQAYCRMMKKQCHVRPYTNTELPDLTGWSSMEGYQKMDVFYWEGSEDWEEEDETAPSSDSQQEDSAES